MLNFKYVMVIVGFITLLFAEDLMKFFVNNIKKVFSKKEPLWIELSKEKNLSIEFIDKNVHNAKWDWAELFMRHTTLPVEFFEKHYYDAPWNWNSVIQYQMLPKSFFENHLTDHKWDWNDALVYQNLDQSFIEPHFEEIPWNHYVLVFHGNLTKDFVTKHIDKSCYENSFEYQIFGDEIFAKC